MPSLGRLGACNVSSYGFRLRTERVILVGGGLVVAGFAARFAIHKAVSANADVDDGLAEATEFFALARAFRLFALCASVFGRAGSGAHKVNVARAGRTRNMTMVTGIARKARRKDRIPDAGDFTVPYNSQQ